MGASDSRLFAVAACLVAGLFAAGAGPGSANKTGQSWNPKAAAAYLDQREGWWAAWPKAARDHQTFCVSCHTAVPYALARSSLRAALAEDSSSPNERVLLDNVTKRVRMWQEVEPFYGQTRGILKPAESRGTESVLNALILSSHDAEAGKLSDDARLAFENMWALEIAEGENKGAWPWLQFDNEPWEAIDSPYYGAALAAVAAGTAPGNYRGSPSIQNHLSVLREYLNREYATQSPINHAVLLWASAKWPDLIPPDLKKSIVDELLSKQQADGGWSLASMVGAWKRVDGTPLETQSDGYATGLVTLALETAGGSGSGPPLTRARAWLVNHQNSADGLWSGFSLNKQRDPSTDLGRFMSDAATAYAVLALTRTNAR